MSDSIEENVRCLNRERAAQQPAGNTAARPAAKAENQGLSLRCCPAAPARCGLLLVLRAIAGVDEQAALL